MTLRLTNTPTRTTGPFSPAHPATPGATAEAAEGGCPLTFGPIS